MRKLIFNIIKLIIALVCSLFAFIICADMEKTSVGASARFASPISAQEAKNAININNSMEFPINATFWKKESSMQIKSNYSSANIPIISLWGKAQSAVPFSLKKGNYPAAYQKGVCAIDEKNAQKLFKSQDVIGKEIEFKGASYEICGIIESPIPIFIIQEEADGFMGMEMIFPKSGDKAQLAENYLMALGLNAISIIDKAFISGLLYFLAIIPYIILAFYFIIKAFSYGKKEGMIVISIMAISIILLINFSSFEFPNGLIPSKWSDFNFWQQRISDFSNSLLQWSMIEQSIIDIAFKYSAAMIIILDIATIALLWLARKIEFCSFIIFD